MTLRNYLVASCAIIMCGCASIVPSRYFALELELAKDDKTRTVQAFWRCDARPFAQGGFGADRVVLTSNSGDGWVIAMPMPRDIYDNSTYVPDLQCTDPDKHVALFEKRLAVFEDPANFACYDDYYPQLAVGNGVSTLRLLSSRIVRPSRGEFVAAQSWTESPTSKAIFRVMQEDDYKGFRALLVPETAWKSDRALAGVLNDKKMFFSSGSPGKGSDDQKEFRRAFFLFLLGKPYSSTRGILGEAKNRSIAERGIMLRGFVLQDGLWEMRQDSTPYVRKCKAEAPINYHGTILRIHGQELFFDPDRRQIVFIVEYK